MISLALVFLAAIPISAAALFLGFTCLRLKRRLIVVSEAADRHRMLVEMAPFPLVITRPADGLVRYINPAAERKFEVSSAEGIGRISRDYYVDPAARDEMAGRVMREGKISNFEVQFKTDAGIPFWADLSASRAMVGGEDVLLISFIDITERKRLERELRSVAEVDTLTGVANRRCFLKALGQEIERCRRHEHSLSLLFMDLDHFKRINDTHGHSIGDAVLKASVGAAGLALRQNDVLGRIGGEEFAVALPETSMDGAAATAERIRDALSQIAVETGKGAITVTTSIGVASLSQTDDINTLLERADRALYKAKHNGRNRVVSDDCPE